MQAINPQSFARPARTARRVIALLCLCLALLVTYPTGLRAANCAGASGNAAVDACGAQLSSNPKDLKVRHALVSALMGLRRHKEAADVLRQGLALSPGENSLSSRLSEVQAIIDEQVWIAKKRQSQAGTAGTSTNASVKLNLIRCTKLQGDQALVACNAGLEQQADNADLLSGKGDALLSLNRVSESIAAYKKALANEPGNGEIRRKLELAESKRPATVVKRAEKPAPEKPATKAPEPSALALKSDRSVPAPVAKDSEPPVAAVALAAAPPKLSVAATKVVASDRVRFSNTPLSPGVTY